MDGGWIVEVLLFRCKGAAWHGMAWYIRHIRYIILVTIQPGFQ